MRESDLALVIIRLNVRSEPHLLLIHHDKWNDWTLVGGHVEEDEKNNWARTAIRECHEEMAPLRYGQDFVLLPLLDRPVKWGPVNSRSADGELTLYTAQIFALRFLRPPSECLGRLSDRDFRIVREADYLRSQKPDTPIAVAAKALGGLERTTLAWDVPLPSTPMLDTAATHP